MRGTNSAAFQPQHNSHSSYYHHPGQAYHQPPVYYPQHMPSRGDFMNHHQAGFDPRKRGIDDLNEFFGSVKRRQVDPTSYQQVGRSLMPLHAPLGLQTGGLATEYMAQPPHTLGMGSMSHGGPGPLTQHYYLPPMPNLRTKDDLQQMDQILQQMQETVYENNQVSNNAQYAAEMRHQSPYPVRPVVDPYAPVSAAQVASPLSATSSHSTGTPAHTPPSSSMSYTSGHSPSASSSGLSPSSRHSSTSVSYPTLPSRAGLPYPTTTGLGSNFTHNERRLSGGVLQSASGRRSADESSDRGGSTPKASDNGMSSVSSPSEESEGAEAETYDDWVQHMRVIEYLRNGIRTRLERREYEEDAASRMDTSRIDPMVLDSDNRSRSAERVERPLYPVLPRIG